MKAWQIDMHWILICNHVFYRVSNAVYHIKSCLPANFFTHYNNQQVCLVCFFLFRVQQFENCKVDGRNTCSSRNWLIANTEFFEISGCKKKWDSVPWMLSKNISNWLLILAVCYQFSIEFSSCLNFTVPTFQIVRKLIKKTRRISFLFFLMLTNWNMAI